MRQRLLEKKEPYTHAVGECHRCHTVVEPFLSQQWFVRMKDLALPAMEAARQGEVRFIPARWEKVYLHWLENIRDLRSSHIGRFICVEGIVRRSSEIRPEIIETMWQCPDCSEIFSQVRRSNFLVEPYQCPKCRNKQGLKQIDKSMEEAAVSLGANPITTFSRVVFPLTKTAFFSNVAFFFMRSMIQCPKMLSGQVAGIL
jgi:DNA replicative helicase MCM subunit Mcm2 (Cdc46/Mcm family)